MYAEEQDTVGMHIIYVIMTYLPSSLSSSGCNVMTDVKDQGPTTC